MRGPPLDSANRCACDTPHCCVVSFVADGFWTFSALGMDRRVGGYEIPAGQMTALNPMIDICIIPIFDLFV